MKQIIFYSMALVVFLTGCASSEKIEIQRDMKELTDAPHTPHELHQFVIDQIKESNDLTAEQKEKLNAMSEEAYQKNTQLRSDMAKLKVLLIEEVMTPKPNSKKIKMIKNQINSKSEDILKNIYEALDSARSLISVNDSSQTPAHYHQMMRLMLMDARTE